MIYLNTWVFRDYLLLALLSRIWLLMVTRILKWHLLLRLWVIGLRLLLLLALLSRIWLLMVTRILKWHLLLRLWVIGLRLLQRNLGLALHLVISNLFILKYVFLLFLGGLNFFIAIFLYENDIPK